MTKQHIYTNKHRCRCRCGCCCHRTVYYLDEIQPRGDALASFTRQKRRWRQAPCAWHIIYTVSCTVNIPLCWRCRRARRRAAAINHARASYSACLRASYHAAVPLPLPEMRGVIRERWLLVSAKHSDSEQTDMRSANSSLQSVVSSLCVGVSAESRDTKKSLLAPLPRYCCWSCLCLCQDQVNILVYLWYTQFKAIRR